MAVFNVPISVALTSYWAILVVGISNMMTMVAAGAESESTTSDV